MKKSPSDLVANLGCLLVVPLLLLGAWIGSVIYNRLHSAPLMQTDNAPIAQLVPPQTGRLKFKRSDFNEDWLTTTTRTTEYERGFNDALDAIMLHDLELELTGQRMTWGKRQEVVRQRFHVRALSHAPDDSVIVTGRSNKASGTYSSVGSGNANTALESRRLRKEKP
jgi:hypothetical protein